MFVGSIDLLPALCNLIFFCTTMATPLSVVKIILLLSLFNSLMPWNSSLVMLDFGICVFLSMFLTSTLSSSASPQFNFEQAFSMATIHSPLGEHLGIIMKFGPWANRHS